jgi:AcrR family transcriptional regulator
METRRTILRTAARMFNEQGYDATSMQAIADEAGLPAQTVCAHFPDKRSILLALARHTARQYGAMLRAIGQLPSGPVRANAMIEQYVALTVANRDVQILRRSDPGIRRELLTTGTVDALQRRGMEVLFGTCPAADQRIAYYLMMDLEDILGSLRDVADDELRAHLTAAARRLLGPVMHPGETPHEFPASGGLAWW